jgi:hypothetical protein
MAYTDKVDGENYNRVLDVDGRYVWKRVHSLSYQVAASANHAVAANGTATDVMGPLWDWRYNLNGRQFSMRASFKGISDRFITQSGFISRTGQTQENVGFRWTKFGERGARVEQLSFDLMFDQLYDYKNFLNFGDARDKKWHNTVQATFKGGWSASAALLLETFGYDPAFYSTRFRILRGVGDTIPFTGTPRLFNRDWSINIGSPRTKHFNFNTLFLYGQDENFNEWSSAEIYYIQSSAEFRPTDQLRIAPSYTMQNFIRVSDGTRVQLVQLTRLRMEYQLTRDLFLRAIGEYSMNAVDALRDDSRTNKPLLVRSGTSWVQSTKTRSNNVRAEFLASYRPTPGTVFYAGYSSLLREPESFQFRDLNRTSDAFFLKASYLFRY